MATVFHLMDFDRVQQFTLIIKHGPFTGDSWKLRDHLDVDFPGVISYIMSSDSVLEEHKIVITYDDYSIIELAIIGVSECG